MLGVGVAGFGLGGMIEKAMQAQETQAKLAAVLRATGEAAGFNADGMEQIAKGLSSVTTFSREAAASAETVLATFSSIRGDNFEAAMKAAADLATVFNMDLSTAAEHLGRALENPADGLRALAKMGVQFSAQQKAVIQNLVDTGQVAKAQAEIIAAVNAKIGDSAVAAAKTAGGALKQLKNDYEDLAATMGKVVLPAVTAVAGSINGIAQASGAIGKVVQSLKSVGSKVLDFAPEIAEAAPAIGVVAAGLTEFVQASNEAYHASQAIAERAAEAHEAPIRAAKRYAEALREATEAASRLARKEDEEDAALIKRARSELSQQSTMAEVQNRLWKEQAELAHLLKSASTPYGGAVHQVTDAESVRMSQLMAAIPRLEKILEALRSNEAAGQFSESAKEAAEEAERQRRDMESHAASIRESIMTPLQRFQATLRELQTLVANHALDPMSAGLAGRAALENLARASMQHPVAAAALSQGSSEAYSAALRNSRNSAENPMLAVAQKQLDQMLKDATSFDQISQTLQNIAGQMGVSETVSM
ncbi:MAG TPA: phage tail length tape measure family protein [Pirellulales bacterium]|nr:phage tail length tape measure family protein [Pirellulales bacterium]